MDSPKRRKDVVQVAETEKVTHDENVQSGALD